MIKIVARTHVTQGEAFDNNLSLIFESNVAVGFFKAFFL